MHTRTRRVAPVILLAFGLAAAFCLPAPACASGYTLHVLHDFSALNNHGYNADGIRPGGTLASDGMGHLYGTTQGGGTGGGGTLFEYDLTTQTFTTLLDFNYTDTGAYPNAGVTLDGQGHIYGTTTEGGTNGDGTVFEYDLANGVFTTLVAFNRANGAAPYGGVTLDGQGNLYGTTGAGGSSGYGTVFKIDLSSNTLTTLVNFDGANGDIPLAGVTLDGQGHLYGTTELGGSGGYGTVFKLNLTTGHLTTLAAFSHATGDFPRDPVTLDGAGHLYGTTSQDGPQGYGMIFKINLATHAFATLAAFHYANGQSPFAPVTLDSSGNLFGTTTSGGFYDNGTVFKVNLGNKVFTTLLNFNGSKGDTPFGGITLDSNGTLYGTTEGGGAHGTGTVYELTPNP